MNDIHDVIKHAKFDDDRFRGSGVVAGQISAFPIDFAGRPYNTLTLPCERVITVLVNTFLFVASNTCAMSPVIKFAFHVDSFRPDKLLFKVLVSLNFFGINCSMNLLLLNC